MIMKPFEKVMDSSDHFAREKRFDQVIVSSKFKPSDPVLLLRHGGENDHRYVAGLAQFLKDLKARFSREHEV